MPRSAPGAAGSIPTGWGWNPGRESVASAARPSTSPPLVRLRRNRSFGAPYPMHALTTEPRRANPCPSGAFRGVTARPWSARRLGTPFPARQWPAPAPRTKPGYSPSVFEQRPPGISATKCNWMQPEAIACKRGICVIISVEIRRFLSFTGYQYGSVTCWGSQVRALYRPFKSRQTASFLRLRIPLFPHKFCDPVGRTRGALTARCPVESSFTVARARGTVSDMGKKPLPTWFWVAAIAGPLLAIGVAGWWIVRRPNPPSTPVVRASAVPNPVPSPVLLTRHAAAPATRPVVVTLFDQRYLDLAKPKHPLEEHQATTVPYTEPGREFSMDRFKLFAKDVLAALPDSMKEYPSALYAGETSQRQLEFTVVFESPTIDTVRTDSIVHPLAGTITFNMTEIEQCKDANPPLQWIRSSTVTVRFVPSGTSWAVDQAIQHIQHGIGSATITSEAGHDFDI